MLAFSIDPATGALTGIGTPQTIAPNGSSLTVDISGKFLYAAISNSSEVSVFSIDSTSGALTAVGTPVSTDGGTTSIVTTGKIQ